MPVSISLAEQDRGVLLLATGAVTGADLLAENERFFSASMDGFAAADYWYSDYSDVAFGEISAEHMHALSVVAETAGARNPGLVVALVAQGDLAFGLARMWERLAEQTGWRVGVRRDRAEAVAWLERMLGRPVHLPG